MDTNNLPSGKRYCRIKKSKSKKTIGSVLNNLKIVNNFDLKSGNKEKNIKERPSKLNKNITKNRLLIKHGLFAKGARSNTITRIGLSEEFKARSEENIIKIIDLANSQKKHDHLSFHEEKKLNKSHQNKEILVEERLNECKNLYPVKAYQKSLSDNEHPCLVNEVNSTNSHFASVDSYEVTSISSVSETNVVTSPSENPNLEQTFLQFSQNISNELAKFIPKNHTSLKDKIKKCLKHTYYKTFTEHFIQQQPPVNSPIQLTAENNVILNPIQYLKNIDTKYVGKFRDQKVSNVNTRKEIPSVVSGSSSLEKYETPSPNPEFIEEWHFGSDAQTPQPSYCHIMTIDTPEHYFLPRRLNIEK